MGLLQVSPWPSSSTISSMSSSSTSFGANILEERFTRIHFKPSVTFRCVSNKFSMMGGVSPTVQEHLKAS
ncbi:unnamed protein product [Victoria cruziana]